MKMLLLLAVAGIALGGPSGEQPSTVALSEAHRPATGYASEYRAVYAPAAPALDGDISDAGWKAAAWSGDFTSREGGGAPKRGSRFKAVYAKDALYVAVECMEPTPEKMADEHQAHEFWLCDVVEIFSCAAKNELLHLVCSARGNLNDEIQGKTSARTKGNVAWQAKSKICADRWTCEFRIPFLLFGAVPADGEIAAPFNVCRNATTVNELSSWSHTRSFKSTANYGTLTLEKAPGELADGLRRLVDVSLIPESSEMKAKREDVERIMNRLFGE